MNLFASLKGVETQSLFRAAAALAPFRDVRPTKLSIDNEDAPIDREWIERCVGEGEVECTITFGAERSLGWKVREATVYLEVPGLPRQAAAILELLGDLPFTLGSFKSIHRWYGWPQYKGQGFGGLLVDHGWGCVFKGEGHARVVSRRWLEHGPWRVVRGGGDLSLVQFHDLEAAPETAFAQAVTGHRLLGNNDDTGFLTLGPFKYRNDLAGLYEAPQRRQKIVVAGRDVGHREMLEACRARLLPQDTERPVDQFAFVFMEEERGRAHVHDLWLRGLECWTIVGGREVQLDATHAPTPAPPTWVAEVEARERGA